MDQSKIQIKNKCPLCELELTEKNIYPGFGLVAWLDVVKSPLKQDDQKLNGYRTIVKIVERSVCIDCVAESNRINLMNHIQIFNTKNDEEQKIKTYSL